MNVSKEARSGAARWAKLNGRNQQAANILRGSCDAAPIVQAFAKFEAEITQRVRDEALEEAARVAGDHWPNSTVAAHKVTVRNIAAAIRHMIGGKA